MKKLSLFFFIILISTFSFSQIINIPYDFPTIQEGIDAANNGDTVLVDVGTYVENINFIGKNITVASHYLTTQDTSYISQTIIDGDQSGSVVMFSSGEDSTTALCGFTIQNGSGFAMGEDTYYYMGGGIYCSGANPIFKNLIITNNHTEDGGGGMFFMLSQSTLQNVIIKNNSSQFGGGININYNTNIIFDSISLCSIYNNQAAIGNDIYSSFETSNQIEITLDTFSVATPTGFYAAPIRNFSFTISNGLTELIDEDLYVSPEGDNNNDGLSEVTAFKTIHYALSKIRADSLHRNTVHLMSGTYSIDSEEIFPIYIPDYTYLKGEDKNTVILDGENAYNSIVYFKLNEVVQISDLTLINGYGFNANNGGGIYCSQANPILKDIIISNCFAFEGSAIYLRDYSNVKLIRVNLIDHNGGGWGGTLSSWGSKVYMEDCIIANNNDKEAIYLIGSDATLTNVLINNNESDGIHCYSSELHIINSTLTNNTSNGGSGGIRSCNSTLNLENTILWNNNPNEISFGEDSNCNDTLYISYSNIEGGEQGIITNDSTTIYWLEGNLNEDPNFDSIGDHPLSLLELSPCIDAGTPDTTGLNLPEYDLAGDIRIFNNRVDMGAYEWNSLDIFESQITNENDHICNVYPNPFTTSASIEYELQQPEKVTLMIYDYMGKQVYQTQGNQLQGEQQLIWSAEGYSDGVYYYRLQVGDAVTNGKMVKVR